MSATFFPREVDVAIARLERDVEAADWEVVLRSVQELLVELRRWEREWRAGRARLVVQDAPVHTHPFCAHCGEKIDNPVVGAHGDRRYFANGPIETSSYTEIKCACRRKARAE